MRPSHHRSVGTLLLLAVAVACADHPTAPAMRPGAEGVQATILAGTQVSIPNVDSLYRAVNNPAAAGAILVLAPGTYALDSTRPNRGRLELQAGMSLRGSVGNTSAVVINAAALPPSSYALVAPNPAQTGAIRLGRGTQVVEWLTVANASNGAAAIETDLVSGGPAQVTLRSLRLTGNRRGIDLRNSGPASAGRSIIASVTGCVADGNTANAGQGMRVLNADTATGAVISVTMSNNVFTGNRLGMFVGNLTTTASTISISSTSDRFASNGVGMGVVGGVASKANANANTISVGMTYAAFVSNTSPLLPASSPFNAGLSVEGGSRGDTGTASSNTAAVNLIVPTFSGNTGSSIDVRAWGARSTTGAVAGNFNTAAVAVVGAVPTVAKVASDPVELVPTNIVSVVP